MKWNMLVGSMVLSASMCSASYAGLLDRMFGCNNTGCDTACCDTVIADPSCGIEMAGCGDGCGVFADPSCGCEMAGGCEPTCGVDLSCGGCEPSCGVEVGCTKPRRKPLLGLLKKMHCKAHGMADKLSRVGCDRGCDSPCGGCGSIDPTCGCEIAAPACGCGSFDPSCGCEMAAPACGCGSFDPSCGCEMAACDSGCGIKKNRGGGLLSKLFKKRGSAGCDNLGCDTYIGAPATSGCSGCGTSTVAPMSAPAATPAPMAAPAPVVDPSAYLNSKRRVIQASTVLN